MSRPIPSTVSEETLLYYRATLRMEVSYLSNLSHIAMDVFLALEGDYAKLKYLESLGVTITNEVVAEVSKGYDWALNAAACQSEFVSYLPQGAHPEVFVDSLWDGLDFGEPITVVRFDEKLGKYEVIEGMLDSENDTDPQRMIISAGSHCFYTAEEIMQRKRLYDGRDYDVLCDW